MTEDVALLNEPSQFNLLIGKDEVRVSLPARRFPELRGIENALENIALLGKCGGGGEIVKERFGVSLKGPHYSCKLVFNELADGGLGGISP